MAEWAPPHIDGQLSDIGQQQQQQAWRTLVVLEDAVNEGCDSHQQQQEQQQRQVFVVKGRLSKAYIWRPGDANSIVDIDVSEHFVNSKRSAGKAQEFQAIASALLHGQGGQPAGQDNSSYDPYLFFDGGTYLEPRSEDVTFIPPQRAKMESPTGSLSPPGFGDQPRRGLPPSMTTDDEEEDEDEPPPDLPPDLADLPSHIREQIDLLVQNEIDLGSQFSAIDALLMAHGLRYKDARMAGSGSSSGTTGPSQDNRAIPDYYDDDNTLSTLSDIDKFIASMAVPPPPGDNEVVFGKSPERASSTWCRAPPVGAEVIPPREQQNAAKSSFMNGHAMKSGLPPPPNSTEVSMDEDMFRIFIPPSEFGLDIDLSKIPTNEVLEDEYMQYVIPPPPVSDVTTIDEIHIVPPVNPPSPFFEKSVVSELAKKLEYKNISFNPDSEIAKRAVVRPLQTDHTDSNGFFPSKENGVTIHVSSANSRSPETPSSVELNPKHSALWKPSQIRSADSSPVHKGKDFLSAALRGSTGTLNRRGRVPPPPPPRRSSIQTESAGSSRSGSPCSTPGADIPSGIPRRDPSRSSAYVNVFNIGSSAPSSPASRHRKISTNSTDSGSTASSVTSAEGNKRHSSNVQEIKKLLESARLSRSGAAALGSRISTVKTGGGEQPASRESSRKSCESTETLETTETTDDGKKETSEANNKENDETDNKGSSTGRPVTMRNKTKEPSQRLRSTFKPDISPTEMPNRSILDDDGDIEVDLTSDLDHASDLANSNSAASKIHPKHRSPSFQRKLLAFEVSKKSKHGSDDMDSAPKESPRSPRLGKDGVPRRSSLHASRTSPLMQRHSGIGKFRSLFSKSDSDKSTDVETQSCPTSPRTNVKSLTLGRSGLRGFGFNNQNKDHRKGIPTRVVKPMMMMSNSDGETSPPPTTKDFQLDFKAPPKNRNSIGSTLASEWVGNMDFDADATYRTFSTFKESPKRRRQPITFSTFRADPKANAKDSETSKQNDKNVSDTKSKVKTNGDKALSDDHSEDLDDSQEKLSSTSNSNAGRRQVFPDECLNKSSPQNSSQAARKPDSLSKQQMEDISHKLYNVPDVFKEIDKDAEILVNTVTKTLKDLNMPSCRKPSEEFQGHKDKLVVEARQFVTDSKLLVSSATQSIDRLTDHVISSMHTLAKLVGHGQDVMLTVRSVPQAHNLGSRLQEVLHAYRLTVSAAHSAVGLPLSDPPMKLLMKQATNLAAILSNLMKTLKILENS